MPTALRVLILDDDPLDAELEIGILEQSGFKCAWEVVDGQTDFVARLDQPAYDLILSDYSLPGFDGLSALRLFTERNLDIPFILISGTVGEEVAIECLKAGATDYVLKTRLSRLAPVVTRALQEKEEQRRRKRAEEALRISEEHLRQSQKMEAVGRLAGGIAHDFNNLLMVMMGYTELLLEQLKPVDPLRDHAHQVWSAGQKATLVTQQLLAFSRKQATVPRVLNLNEVLADLAKMLPRLIGETVELSITPLHDLWLVRADLGHTEQVIMNLVVNARDAMPHGGTLMIHTDNIEFTADNGARPAAIPDGKYVLLCVRDTGLGIDEQTLPRIFEPFFTTKEAGKGTGLGLAMVYGIVQQSGGYIDVHSQLNVGTRFNIYLPRVTGTTDNVAIHPSVESSSKGMETILLVEDEEGVRNLVTSVLQTKGYTVLEASNADQALQLAKQYAFQIHLLLTDVVLPRITGRELAQRLEQTRPETKVLYMSGYTDETIMQMAGFNSGTPFLQKPFNTETLTLKIRELLDGNLSSAAASRASRSNA